MSCRLDVASLYNVCNGVTIPVKVHHEFAYVRVLLDPTLTRTNWSTAMDIRMSLGLTVDKLMQLGSPPFPLL